MLYKVLQFCSSFSNTSLQPKVPKFVGVAGDGNWSLPRALPSPHPNGKTKSPLGLRLAIFGLDLTPLRILSHELSFRGN